jgi:FtsP/CotA-like multicopper oxidase with cupredoxin domain
MNTPKRNNYIGIIVIIVLLGGVVWLAGRYRNDGDQGSASQQGLKLFSSETAGLPDAVPMPTIELKDGDTYELIAQQVKKNINGQVVKMLAYNGSIPGPLIKVQQGAEVTVRLTNNTDVETTLHSHGVRVDNAFDGIPDITQDPIPVGGSFTYRLKFPDAGIYWYHPHIREDYAQELGLYGNLLVEPQDTALWSPVNREVPLVLDDILIENLPAGQAGGRIAPFAENESSHTLMGRFGNVMLVNGETNFNLDAKSGEVVRFFVTNVANTRTFKLGIPGATMKLGGGDGGPYERETFVDSVTISPSERTVVDVLFESTGTYPLQHTTPQQTYSLGTVAVDSEIASPFYAPQFFTARVNEGVRSEIDTVRPLLAKAVDKSLKIGIDMGTMNMMGNMGHGGHMTAGDEPIEWEDDMAMMNRISTTESVQWKLIDEATGKSNMDIDWKFKVGDKVKIKITNDADSMHPMQHPIHLHGQRFVVTSTNGVPNDNLVWKDTALVQTGDTVELLVDMTNPGEWMLHCHIAEHLEDGMMLPFTVSS